MDIPGWYTRRESDTGKSQIFFMIGCHSIALDEACWHQRKSDTRKIIDSEIRRSRSWEESCSRIEGDISIEAHIPYYLSISDSRKGTWKTERIEWLNSTVKLYTITSSREVHPASSREIECSRKSSQCCIETRTRYRIPEEIISNIEKYLSIWACHRYHRCRSIYRSCKEREWTQKYSQKNWKWQDEERNRAHHVLMLSQLFAKSEFWVYFSRALDYFLTSPWQLMIIPVL